MLLAPDAADFADALRAFAADHVAPVADEIDRIEAMPKSVTDAMARAGLFASGLPEAHGGSLRKAHVEEDWRRHGLIHEALGAASASVQGLLNVHHMGASPIARWGSAEQKARWLPPLAAGQMRAALAITEPNVGSDAAAVETKATPAPGGWSLTGVKTWITCGQNADLFVLLAGTDDGPAAFIVPRETDGLSIEPIPGILGCRGYMLATLFLDGCELPADQMLGRPAFGLSHVVATGLNNGRFNLAWGCVGLAQACLDASMDYARSRRQFGAALADTQLVQRMLARMMTDIHAARLMCADAGVKIARRDPGAIKDLTMAKYFASQMVNRAAYDAVQVHGAHGCGPYHPIQRYLRDARIMEIIEGSTQVLELAIAQYGLQERRA